MADRRDGRTELNNLLVGDLKKAPRGGTKHTRGGKQFGFGEQPPQKCAQVDGLQQRDTRKLQRGGRGWGLRMIVGDRGSDRGVSKS